MLEEDWTCVNEKVFESHCSHEDESPRYFAKPTEVGWHESAWADFGRLARWFREVPFRAPPGGHVSRDRTGLSNG